MSTLDHATKLTDALQVVYNTDGISGIRNEDTDSKHPRKLFKWANPVMLDIILNKYK
jgi:hypothetical protein